jgi:hypothetical protein
MLRSYSDKATFPLFELYTQIRDGGRIYARGPQVDEALSRFTEAKRLGDRSFIQSTEEELEDFDITHRLLEDVINLLTELRSEAAKKAFIEYIRDGYPSGVLSNGEPIYREMRALIEMKSFAVSDLIHALDTSDEQPENAVDGQPRPKNPVVFQERLIRILGRIGDPKALPALERARKKDDCLKQWIDEAVREITESPR